MEKRLMMFLVGLFLSLGTALAQTEISGTVVSSSDGQPVVGASILVSGTQNGTVTDIDGISDKKRPKMGLFCSYMTKRDLKHPISLYLQGE